MNCRNDVYYYFFSVSFLPFFNWVLVSDTPLYLNTYYQIDRELFIKITWLSSYIYCITLLPSKYLKKSVPLEISKSMLSRRSNSILSAHLTDLKIIRR